MISVWLPTRLLRKIELSRRSTPADPSLSYAIRNALEWYYDRAGREAELTEGATGRTNAAIPTLRRAASAE